MQMNQKWTIWLLSIGVFMGALDNGIITAALTTLYGSFGVTPIWGSWSITLYTLGLAVSVPIVGRLSDRFGRKKLFLIEVALFGIGSLLVALSPNFTWFLVARVIQAFGGGGIFILASAYVLNAYPKEVHGRMLGMLGGMNGIAAVLGPNIGALILTVTGSWHWLFLINVPIAIILFFAGTRLMQEQVAPSAKTVDWAGIVLLTGGILSLMISLTQLDGLHLIESMMHWQMWGLLLFAIGFLIWLIRAERRVASRSGDPFLPIELFKSAVFRWSLVLGFLSGAILSAVIFIPSFVEQFLGVSAASAGIWFTPLALASGIGAAGGGAMVDRQGPIKTMFYAGLICLVGFALFPLWVSVAWQLIVASCIVGLGFGIMLGAPINVLATERSGEHKGMALATLSLARQIGLTLCPTIFAGFLARPLADWSQTHLQQAMSYLYTTLNNPQTDDVWAPQFQYMSSEEIIQWISQFENESIRVGLMNSYEVAIQSGYAGLFWTAAVFSFCVIFVTWITSRTRLRTND